MLGHSTAAFGQILATTKNSADRATLLEQVEAAHTSVKLSPTATPDQKRRASTLFHGRLLEYVREPRTGRGVDGRNRVEFSQIAACHRLARERVPDLVPILRDWLSSSNRRVREAGADAIAYCASDDLIDEVVALLTGSDWAVAAHALTGAGLAAFHKLPSARYRKAVFDAAAPLLTGDFPPPPALDAVAWPRFVDAAFYLDRRRAISLLRSERCITHTNPVLKAVVWGLQPAQLLHEGHPPIVVKPQVLWSAFEPLDAARRESPLADSNRDFTIGCLLVLGATSDPDRTKKVASALKRQLSPEQFPLRDFCNEAVRRARRVPEPDAALRWAECHPGIIGDVHECVLMSYAFAEHVNNDGLRAFVTDRRADVLRATRGLEALGLVEAARLLREAASVDDDQTVSHSIDALNHVEAKIERHLDRILAAVERYISTHAREFRVVLD